MAATVRLATRVDVPLVNAMVHELAEVEGKASDCKATDAKLNALLFRQAPFQGPTVLMLEIDAPTKEAVKGNKEEDAMSGTVVTKPMPETSGQIPGQEPPVKTRDEDMLESTESVELMLFRSVSNVKYKERFFSEVTSPKSSDFLSEVSSTKSSFPLETNLETDMEEPVLEVFRSRSDVNLKERDASAAASDDAKTLLGQDSGSEARFLEEIVGEFSAWSLVEDSESETFRSPCADGKESRIVVGYVHIFPSFSTYLSKAGLFMEAFYIRKPYRHLGLGKMFLKKIAREAVKLGMERVEWPVLYSNDPAIKFCEGMGAVIKPTIRKCAIDGQALDCCAP